MMLDADASLQNGLMLHLRIQVPMPAVQRSCGA